jgi:hypothetical protein
MRHEVHLKSVSILHRPPVELPAEEIPLEAETENSDHRSQVFHTLSLALCSFCLLRVPLIPVTSSKCLLKFHPATLAAISLQHRLYFAYLNIRSEGHRSPTSDERLDSM